MSETERLLRQIVTLLEEQNTGIEQLNDEIHGLARLVYELAEKPQQQPGRGVKHG